jgi:photosystem II stability/assembly factor-like uncharacterized protein
MIPFDFRGLAARALAAATMMMIAYPVGAQTLALADLRAKTHIHGIAVDPKDGSRLYLATHHGFFTVSADGQATRVSRDSNDYMGFTPHPTDPSVLFASGHPAGGGNLGFIVSGDGGQSWRQLSTGVRGPVDFHQMDISKSDANVIYGAFGGLQVSHDGGKSWKLSGPLPDGLIDLAASAVATDRLYAATKGGLLYSEDAGTTWRPAHFRISAATMVQTGHKGELYAFIIGLGLLRTQEPELRWEIVNKSFGNRYLLHLAVDPSDPRRLYVVTNDKQVLVSTDNGVSWVELGGAGSQ